MPPANAGSFRVPATRAKPHLKMPRTVSKTNSNYPRRFVLSAHSTSLALYAIVAIVLLYGVIYPTAHVFIAALQHEGGWSPANFFGVLAQRAVIESAATRGGESGADAASDLSWLRR